MSPAVPSLLLHPGGGSGGRGAESAEALLEEAVTRAPFQVDGFGERVRCMDQLMFSAFLVDNNSMVVST